jgi:hypothetical protein
MKFSVTRKKLAAFILLFSFFVAAAIVETTFFGSDSIQHARFAIAQSTATTTVTILNTPPLWTVNAFEAPASATSTPTNAGNTVTWQAVGTDPNSDNYYLLLCKNSSTPIAANGAAPSCNGGGSNQWAVSTSTVSGASSTASYVTQASDPQINPWFGWICDGNAGGAQCNAAFQQGSGNSGSPFVVNHKPNFSTFSNNSPAVPGATVTWTALASDTDNFTGSTDTVQLFVCKAADFTGTACGAAGSVCSSAASLVNPTCTSSIAIPTQDQGYSTFGYIIDQHQFPAVGGPQGSNATETVSAVAPTIASSSINLLNVGGSSTPLTLTNPGGQTTGFQVTFTASDNNSCLNPVGGQEVATASIDVFRSGVGLGSCSSTGNYNPSSCYPTAVGSTTWPVTCSQNGGSCSGSSSINSQWTCTFPLWYVADPTDGTATSTQYYNQSWVAAVQATSYLGATSTVTQGSATNSVISFLASQLNTPGINFGALTPGSTTPTTAASTTMSELGNIGLNETLYGVSLCPNYPTCPVSTTSTIPVNQIVYASSVVAYGSGVSLAVNPGSLFAIQILKSTSTATSSLGATYWGISVPSTIQLSGAYTGQNTFIATRSAPSTW